jgi:hypothetical protein
MNEHSCVARWEPLDNEDEYLYRIIRTRGLPDVRVHLTDAYDYSRAEYLARPSEVMQRNSFIVLGLPHAHEAGSALIAEARSDGVGIGKIGKFMGALNSRDVSVYETLEERRERETGRRWG